MPLTAIDHLKHAQREFAALRDALSPLHLPVPTCPGWTLRDLAEHVGGSNLWAAYAITEGRGDFVRPPAPDDILPWFEATGQTLFDALARDPEEPAWSFGPEKNVGFWRRRRCMEFLLHRWDAEGAHGEHWPIDTELAWDGVLEVFEVMAPRQIERGRATAPTHAVEIRSGDRRLVYGPGEPVGVIEGPPDELLLALWGRRPLDTELLPGPLTS